MMKVWGIMRGGEWGMLLGARLRRLAGCRVVGCEGA